MVSSTPKNSGKIRRDVYVSVADIAQSMGFNVPTGLALLPRHFEKGVKADLVHEGTAITIRKLWREAKVVETPLEAPNEKLPCIHENSVDWIGPTVFIGALAVTQNPAFVQIALGVISNYVTDWFKGAVEGKKVRLSVVIEETNTRKCTRIECEGPPSGVESLVSLAKEIRSD